LENVEIKRKEAYDVNVVRYKNMITEIMTTTVTTDIQILFFITLLNFISSIIILIQLGTIKSLSLIVKVYVEW
jgi:hypothetical protein